jgi:hypothetical protein
MRPGYILPILLVSILIPTLNQVAEPEIMAQLHSLNVTQSGPHVHICAEVYLESRAPGIEYCSLDLMVDGVIVEAACWSDLPDVPWASSAVTAPTILNVNRTITLRDGAHELRLESYARNTENQWTRYTSPTVTLTRGRGGGSQQSIRFTDVKAEPGTPPTVSASMNYTSPGGAVELSYGLLVEGEASETTIWTSSGVLDTCLIIHKRYTLNASAGRVHLIAAMRDRNNNTVLRISPPITFIGISEEQGTPEAPCDNLTLQQVTIAGRQGNSTTVTLERLVDVDPGPTPWLTAPSGKVKLTVTVQPDDVPGLAASPEPGVYLAEVGSTVYLYASSGGHGWVFREWAVSRAGDSVTRTRGIDGCVEVELTRDTVVTALYSQVIM